MTTLLIFFLIFITIIFIFFKKSKLAAIFLILAFVIYWLVGSGVFAYYLLAPLQAYPTLQHPQWKKSNAIVVLGGGTVQTYGTKEVKPYILVYGRLTEAAKLYFSCQKAHETCKLILSGGDVSKMGQSEAGSYRKNLAELGVRPDDCILDTQSTNTYYNAKNVTHILSYHHFDQIVLVTSGYHIARSNLSFEHFGIHALLAPADIIRAKLSVKPLASNFLMTDVALHEYLGILYYQFYWFKK